MSLQPDQMLCHYRLVEKIGQGGMGEVWKARDTTLDREAAIKVLPEAFSCDAERLARFEREAKILATLKHPNIAAIYGLHEEEGARFLAMELIAGEDLAVRLDRGSLPLPEVLEIAGQLVDALEAAHDNGIVHRDLKPANIVVEPGNRVKVLDFGLARNLEPPGGSGDSSLSPTVTSLGTIAGAILGTAAYMSPEQARGDSSDRRADIWSLGCVIYEMLVGERPFPGESISDTLATVLKSEPDWDRLPAATPPSLRRLLRRCLAKQRRNRLHAVGDVRLDLEDAGREADSGPEASTAPPRTAGMRFIPWMVAAVGVVASVVAFLGGLREATPAPATTRFHVDVEAPNLIGGSVPIAVSPDGRALAYSAMSDAVFRIYLRRLDEFESEPLAGSENGDAPFFSPDGQWIGYFTGGRLMKQSLVGGRPQELAPVPHAPGGASWGPDGTIVFATAWARNGLHVVAEDGSETRVLTEPDLQAGELFHRWPQVLPDGDSILFTVSRDRSDDVAILSMSSGTWELLPEIRGRAHYVDSGHLIYGDGEALLAAKFDLATRRVAGPPVPLLEGIGASRGGGAVVQISEGTLIQATWDSSERRIIWVDRNGSREDTPYGVANWMKPAISPDGARLAIAKEGDTAIQDLRRGSRLMIDDAVNPQWTPDGKSLVVTSQVTGVASVYVQAVGDGQRRKVAESEHALWVNHVSPDGRHVAFYEQHPETGRDIWVAGLEEGSRSEPLIATPANERSARFSPDGRWIAYTSDRSGRDEVYVRQFEPRGEMDQLISIAGGREPVWSRDGTELFYRTGNSLVAVPLEFTPEFQAGSPVPVFDANWAIDSGGLNQMYDVTPDGRFLVIEGVTEGKIAVITGWQNGLDPTH
jgi:serine/threonine-protein kinase